ncbi:MAG: DUF309 domain-containing protein [Bacteriovoracaceae bacterium]|nr:DUF309 domain-containing protein [Bacteriovoracaceae bacterium]
MSNENFGFSHENLKKVKKGVELFNTGHFWDCHEELEHWWLEDRGDNARLVYWAIIQVAACLYHLEKENLAGCQGMIKKTWDKLERTEKAFVENEITEKFLNWSTFKSLCRSIPENSTLDSFKELYKYKFPDPESWEFPNE